MSLVDLAGRKFGRLTVMCRAARIDGRTAWHCHCDCGTELDAKTDNLQRGHKKSCGCLHRDSVSEVLRQRNTTHNATHNGPTFWTWTAMMQRCYNKNQKCYKNYGGRGIRVCERWHDYWNFYADMGDRPSKLHSLDRHPNANGNYEPGNCRWATRKEQNRNTRSTVFVTIDGVTDCLKGWSERSGIAYGTIFKRFHTGRELLSPVNTKCSTKRKGHGHG